MILRRIVQGLKARDWAGVAIELLLVVLGVFIGIEVSNWNASRRERALEATYFERIAGDVRSDIAEMQEIVRVATVRM
ncbi:MAG TPA: hypothetical protein VFO79_16705 [Xanthomonadales bacterium]|nr:hypothetical protein [Xanthomonadales bacterium]